MPSAQRGWFGGRARFTPFQWHYDVFDLPAGATRVLTNRFNPNQGYVIDERHIGFQCHIEMTRDLVETWCAQRRRRNRSARNAAAPVGATRSCATCRRDLLALQARCRRRLRALGRRARALMGAIRALPDLLINQIAAGEVVERPAAALKELLENALDAHATQIDVDVAAGGVKRIRVADNGAGIEREDLALAVARHATSKIASVLDLEAIATLGFRGEALASIAAVARVAIASRALAKPHAWRIEVEGGTVGAVAPAALAAGTTVTIEELYFNTPARRKFLRTEATEWAHCDEAFRRIALAHPDVAFTLTHNGRALHRLQAGGRRARVEALLGDAFVLHAAPVDADAGDVRLTGLAVRPGLRRRRADDAIPFRQRPLRARPRARRMRCAKRIATSCITTGSRRTRCGCRSIRAASTSTCIRRRPRCAFAIPARSTSSSATPSSVRWRRPRPSSRRSRRRSGSASPRRTCRRACRRQGRRRPSERAGRAGADQSATARGPQRALTLRSERARGVLSAALRRARG